MFRNVPECSSMFRNVPCSGFYRRPWSRHSTFTVIRKVSSIERFQSAKLLCSHRWHLAQKLKKAKTSTWKKIVSVSNNSMRPNIFFWIIIKKSLVLQSNQENREHQKYFWNVIVLQQKSQSGGRKVRVCSFRQIQQRAFNTRFAEQVSRSKGTRNPKLDL